jgi:large subunit ribosomal protein L29
MKQKEIKILSNDELVDKLGELSKTLYDAQVTHTVSPLENPLQIRNIRRTIARLKAEISNRSQK